MIWFKIKRKSIKNIVFVIAIFTVGSLLLISILTGFSNIIELVTEPLLFVKMLGKSPWAPWPDVYSIVSELQKPSIREVIDEIGLALFIGIIGIVWMFRVLVNDKLKKRFNRIKWFFLSFLLVWIFFGLLIIIGGGNRFVLLIISPLVISAGIMIGILIEYPKLLKDSLGLNKETAMNRLINNYHLTEEQNETILNLTHPDITRPFVLVTTDELRNLAYFIFTFREWDLNSGVCQDYTYSIVNYEIEKDVLKSKNGISMDMETGDIKWDGIDQKEADFIFTFYLTL